MNKITKDILKKIIAVCLSVFILIGIIPVSQLKIYAITGLSFTVMEEDGVTPIADANIKITQIGQTTELDELTDSNGIATFNAITDTDIENGIFEGTYTISKEGYEDITGEINSGTGSIFSLKMSIDSTYIQDSDFEISVYKGVYDGSEHSVVEVIAEDFTVTYSDNGINYVSEVPTITDAGSKKIYIKLEKNGYTTRIIEATAEVSKIDRTDFAFGVLSPDDLDYETDLTYTNTASSIQEPCEIVYTSLNSDIANVNSTTGVISFKKAGTVTIEAVMSEGTNYNESRTTYTITANTLPRQSFKFETSQPSNLVYKENLSFLNKAEDSENDGNIEYSIISQSRDGELVAEGDAVATINKQTGELTILTAGTVEVKAVVSEGDYYKEAEITYSITIERATQTGFVFEESNPESIKYGTIFKNPASGGESSGKITYDIKDGSQYVSIEDDGKIKAILAGGTATITATKAADNCYEKAIAEYSISTKKAEQSEFYFEKDKYEVNYGNKNLTVKAEGGNAGEITYSITAGEDKAVIDESTGVITFNSTAKGKISIKAVKSGDDNYEAIEAYATVEIRTNDFSDKYILDGNVGENNWYTGNVTIKPDEGYVINTVGTIDSEWMDSIIIETEGEIDYPDIYLKNVLTQEISEKIELQTIYIDKTNPENLKIEYAKSVIDIIIEGVTFGFYDKEVEVTVNAIDAISGIDHFTYKLGENEFTIDKSSIDYDNGTATAKFSVQPQYRNKVVVTAYDEAGNKIVSNEEKVIVVDNVAPGVSVQYDNNTASNTNFYKANRTATIIIKDENFFKDNLYDNISGTDEKYLVITVGKRLNSEIEYTEEEITPNFVFSERDNGYIAKVEFNEDADYTFDIKFTDYSGNVYDSYDKDEFTIDKTSPVIKIDYNNKEAVNNNYYNDYRTATIKVKEHNFNPKDIKIKFNESTSADLSDKNYSEYLMSMDNWAQNGDEYTASIIFDREGKYNFEITYVDLAGIQQATPIIEDFCIDKTKPECINEMDSDNVWSIKYSKSVWETILETVTFGFYKSDVKVTITAKDDISGIDYFTYYCNSSDGNSYNRIIQNKDITFDGKQATATFKILAQFRGNVSFSATDMSGNISELFNDNDDNIIVDDVAAKIDITYDNNIVKNSTYYNNERTATIAISESNFVLDDLYAVIPGTNEKYLVITVGKRLNNEKEYTKTTIEPVITKKGDMYIAKVKFNEDADYTLDVKFTDLSRNVTNKHDKFTIDKTNPVITISFDNNNCVNGDKFNSNRKATITIEEHNFNPKDIEVTVNANNTVGTATDYKAILQNSENWKTEGDVHKAIITFSTEADYTFDINYSDMAGRKAAVDYGSSVAVSKFTIDKTNPSGSITIGNWTQSVNGTKWNKFLDNISYSYYTDNSIKVAINNIDTLSGIAIIEHFRSAEPLTLAQVKASTKWISENADKRTFSYMVEPDEKFIVYVHIVDKAGNECYISSDGIIVDKTKPDIEQIAPEIMVEPVEKPINGIYNSDVNISVKVTDPIVNESYSGLKSITYEVYNNSLSTSEPTQTGILFEFERSISKYSDLVSTYNRNSCITVDKNKNNSNDVIIKITSTDNAGNTSVKTCPIKIDTTVPIIDISYSNNEVAENEYFKTDRTATISITERNFDESKVNVTITNTDGIIPNITNWTKVEGSGNKDNTKWISTITYSTDGDYTFEISYTDNAGNSCKNVQYADGTVAENKFTIDKTIPIISVSYDNNNFKNSNFYNDTRIATITINEHNFDEKYVISEITAKEGSENLETPVISTWKSDGDIHTATITYKEDATYTFSISFSDIAANEAEKIEKQMFYVDKTMPEISITGIENNSANSGDVKPSILFSDRNFDADTITIKLDGVNRGESLELKGEYQNTDNGKIFNFYNFEDEKDIDDIYTLTAVISDKAGNSTTKSVVFSVNRYGSTYKLNDETKALNGTFTQQAKDVVLKEINANELSNIKITLYKNNETITLAENVDYKIDINGSDKQWYCYTYTIFKENFIDDGVYRLNIHSEDEAGNVAENTLDTKETEISFGVDNTSPIVILANVESKKTYAVDNLTVHMTANDNLKLATVKIYLDDYSKVYKEWNEEEIENITLNNEDFVFDISGDSTSAHKIKVVCVDAAGKETIEEVSDFYVTTNTLIQFYANKPLFYGSIGGIFIILGGIIFIIVFKRKRNKKQTNDDVK